MPKVFLSYAGEQKAIAQRLESELTERNLKVWRDKTNLHAGERWPKALGDAIANSDGLILLWSAQAEQSDFVELEWNIAVAMQKAIMPCLLDDTPLPPTLKPLHSIPGDDLLKALAQIETKLRSLSPSAPNKQQSKLLGSLDLLGPEPPKEVLQKIHDDLIPPKPWVERAGAWVSLVAGILIICFFVMVLPSKIRLVRNGCSISPPIQEYSFEGQVLDLQGRGLGGATVSLIIPGQESLTVETPKTGVFTFKVHTVSGKFATLYVEKPGFTPNRRNVTIPDQRYVLKMKPRSTEENR